jgi:uncharacterized protein YndB with AHSA1/START domain
MSTTTTTENLVVELRRTFPVSRERIFAAWTDPAEARQWFGPEGCRIRDFQMDARVGGKYVISIDQDDGEVWQVMGEFREVVRPEKLIYTWRWADDPAWEGIESVITVEFTEQGSGTEVHLVHERFPSEESRNNHEKGWPGVLDKLERYLAK